MRVARAVAVIATLAVTLAPSSAVASSVPPRFVVDLDMPGNDYVFGLAATTAGNAVVGITSDRGAWLAMLGSDGTRHQGFGDGGVRRLPVRGAPTGVALVATRDDAVIALAVVRSDSDLVRTPSVVLAKVRADGSADASFGDRGLARASLTKLRLADYAPVAAAEAPDGGILVLVIEGAASYYGGATAAALVRFDPHGALDPAFGINGTMPVNDVWAGYAGTVPVGAFGIDGHGRILIGDLDLTGAPFVTSARVRRLTAAGTPDATFGAGGVAHADFAGSWENPLQLLVERGGRVSVFGYSSDGVESVGRAVLGRPVRDGFAPGFVRLRSDGRVDRSFGYGGRSAVRATPPAHGLSFGGGAARAASGSYYGTGFNDRLSAVLFRLSASGFHDRTFGSGGLGIVTPVKSQGFTTAIGRTVIVAGLRHWSTGGVVVAGYAEG